MSPDCEKFKMFRSYYEKQWLLRIPTTILSCSNNKHRTTNLLEGWHHRIAVKLPKNPNLYNFLHKIRKESIRYDYKIRNSLFYSVHKNRRKSDIAFDCKYEKYLKLLGCQKMSPLHLIQKLIFLRLSQNISDGLDSEDSIF